MRSIDLATFATAFPAESDLRGAIADLLTQLPNSHDAKITHGSQEHGKDLIFRTKGPFQESVLCACVVKNTKITGAVDSNQGAMTVLNQVKQCLTHPYLNTKGEEERIGQVYVISPYDCSQIAVNSIKGELEHRSGQVTFMCGQDLLSLFETYLPDFLLLQSGFLTKYLAVLRQQLDEDSALSHIAFKHGILAKAKKSTARVYVRPRFNKELSEFAIHGTTPLQCGFLTIILSQPSIKEFQAKLEERISLIQAIAQSWEPPPKGGPLMALTVVIRELNGVVARAWDQAYSAYCSSCKSKGTRALGANQVSLQLPDAKDLSSEAERLIAAADKAINEFRMAIDRANAYSKQEQREPAVALASAEFIEHGRVWDTARPASSPVRVKKRGRVLRFSEDLLLEYEGDLMITAPAGYGKTSFCKWSALHDGELFAEGVSKTVPVYVALQQLARSDIGTFEHMFFRDPELIEMAKKRKRANGDLRFRLYLDGLDEIVRERQPELIELALSGKKQYTGLQIVLTARDHVFGPWLSRFPRISLSELSKEQVRELVSALLDGDPGQTDEFFRQLGSVPVLQPLMCVPLLGTLVVAVYRNMTTLPEGKAELYRIFVDLLCGGWDMAKGVKRESEFGSALKLRILIRLSSILHEARTRVGTSAPFKSVIQETAPVLADQWEAVLADMVQDGFLTRNGSTFSFAHLSFQEYLAARDLADPTNKKQDEALTKYLEGDDWWEEVMAFYVAMSKRPKDMEAWVNSVRDKTEQSSKRAEPAEVRRRACVLRDVIVACSPAYRHGRAAS